jgi:L-ascorbate metabolism protein UlaG (beta-lactamase superfamily)
MKSQKISLCFLLCLLTFNTIAQYQTDAIQTRRGDLIVSPVQHATFVLSWQNKTIYVDPTGGAAAFKSFKKPDIILLTDIHGDHCDVKTLEAILTPNTIMVAPQAVADLLPASLKAHLSILKNGDRSRILQIPVKAVAMYNLPVSDSARHVKGRGNGYVLKLSNRKVYISGDTEDIPEMRRLHDIDVAFVCMNLPYTYHIQWILIKHPLRS